MHGRSCRSVIVLLGLLSLGLGGSIRARAGEVPVNFTATIETISDPQGEFAGANLKPGDSFTGTLIYDTQAQAVSPGSNPTKYDFTSASSPAYATPLGFNLNIGGHNIVPDYSGNPQYPPNMVIQVQNDLASQTYPSMFTASSTVKDTTANQNSLLASIALGDSSGTDFTSTALPSSLDLSKFDAGQFEIQYIGVNPPPLVLTAEVTVGNSGPQFGTPEPSSLVPMSLAILGIYVIAELRHLAILR